jgi:deoxyribodipyrimidine photolyase
VQRDNVVKVIANHDYEPYAIKRDLDIGTFLGKMGIAFETFKDQVIFEKMRLLSRTAHLILFSLHIQELEK